MLCRTQMREANAVEKRCRRFADVVGPRSVERAPRRTGRQQLLDRGHALALLQARHDLLRARRTGGDVDAQVVQRSSYGGFDTLDRSLAPFLELGGAAGGQGRDVAPTDVGGKVP